MQMLEAFRALNALNEDIFSLDAEGVGKLSDFTQNDDLEDNVQIIDPAAETEDDLQDNYIGKVILDCCVCHSKLYKDKSEITISDDEDLANVGEECPYCFTPDGFKVIGEVVAFGEEPEEQPEEKPEEEAEESIEDDAITEGVDENGRYQPTSISKDRLFTVYEMKLGTLGSSAANFVIHAAGVDANTASRIVKKTGGRSRDYKPGDEKEAAIVGDAIKGVKESLTEDVTSNIPGARGNSVRGIGASIKGSGTNFKSLEGKKTKKVLAKDLKPGMITDTGKILKVTDCGNSIEVSYGGIGNRGSHASDNVDKDHVYNVLDESISLHEADDSAFLNNYKDKIMQILKCIWPANLTSSQITQINQKLNSLRGTPVGNTLTSIVKTLISNDSENPVNDKEKNQGSENVQESLTEDSELTSQDMNYIKANKDKFAKFAAIISPDADKIPSSFKYERDKKIRDMTDNTQKTTLKDIITAADADVAANTAENKAKQSGGLKEDIEDLSMTSNGTRINESLEDIKKIKDFIEKMIVAGGYSETSHDGPALFASWLSNYSNFDKDKIVEVAFLLGYDIYSTDFGYYGGKDYLIVCPGESPDIYLTMCDDADDWWYEETLPSLAKVESLTSKQGLVEGIEDLSMTANGTHVDVSEEENGKVTVTMEPATANSGEMIAPVSNETESELLGTEDEFNLDEIPYEDAEVDAEFDEFDEEAMDGLGESYFKRVYENVNSFKTTAVKTSGNSMIIEGLLEFESGNKKNTSFIFEALDATKTGKFRFVGDNKELTEGKKAFMLTGTINNNKLMVESMNYNYKHIDAEGKSSRVYGTERFNKGE